MAQCRRIIFNNLTMSPRSLFNEGFTPLESPAACSGDEDIIPFRANMGFNAPCEPLRWKVEDFLTGFTWEFKKLEEVDIS